MHRNNTCIALYIPMFSRSGEISESTQEFDSQNVAKAIPKVFDKKEVQNTCALVS